jgi:Kef-type K+ transport system membrane component KefB|tara:strand:+ start:3737 stop:3859 length:123 start_codon:yes stop_codon:yes gene_type:complete
VLESVVAIIAVLLVIPGWAIGLLAIGVYLWRRVVRSMESE